MRANRGILIHYCQTICFQGALGVKGRAESLNTLRVLSTCPFRSTYAPWFLPSKAHRLEIQIQTVLPLGEHWDAIIVSSPKGP